MRGSKATFYFSFRSPYSWLAARRLQESGIRPGGEVRFMPFWEPDAAWQARLRERGKEFPYVPMGKDKHLYILGDIKRLASRLGLSLTWPIDRDPDWSVPHLCYLAAANLGLAESFLHLVYAARWEHGLNVWSWDTMADLEGRLGVSSRRLITLARDEETAREGLEALCAVVKDGVFGVPFFLYGREKFWGIDRLDAFLSRLAAGRVETAQAPVYQGAAFSSFVADHAGGCG